jgi:hypothetical protein
MNVDQSMRRQRMESQAFQEMLKFWEQTPLKGKKERKKDREGLWEVCR